jgi:hypothetical protein
MASPVMIVGVAAVSMTLRTPAAGRASARDTKEEVRLRRSSAKVTPDHFLQLVGAVTY